MKNFLNIILVFSVMTWLGCGILLPILHFIDFFHNINEIKDITLTVMLCSMGVTTPIGLYNHFSGLGITKIEVPKNKEESFKKSKIKPGCSSCKKKK